jgi:hypothetical protein
MHWDGYDKDHRSIGTDTLYAQPDTDGFITVGLLWTPGLAVYYYNGREAARWENPRIGNIPSAIMFTLPMGGWDNNALEDARLPADFIIDYVRVWQRKGLAAAALKNDDGSPASPADLRLAHLRSGDEPIDLFRTLSTGLNGTPMVSFADALPDPQKWDVIAYILSLRRNAQLAE